MRFMELSPPKPGYCWENVAPLGADPVWREVVAPWSLTPKTGTLFGYGERAFLAKQYK